MSVPSVVALLVAMGSQPLGHSILIAQQAEATRAAVEPSLFLKVEGGILGTADIRAVNYRTREVVERLKKDLKLPINASAIVADHRLDLNLKHAPVTTMLGRMAPVVLADIEVGGDPNGQWKAIHLLGYNEKEPERALKQAGVLIAAGVINDDGTVSMADPVTSDAQAISLIDEKPENADKPILAVMVKDGLVTFRSQKQHLVGLLNEIAVRAKIPFEVTGEVDPVPVDLKLSDLPLRDLPAAIGRRGIRILVRRNLVTGEEFVQGILVGETAKAIEPVELR